MTLSSEEITALQEKANLADELQQRILAVDGKKTEILDEKKKLQQRVAELEQANQERQKKELEDQGRTAELLERERAEREQLQRQLQEKEDQIAEVEARRVQDRLRADFAAVFSASEVFAPDHVWMLMRSSIVDDDGRTFASRGGAKITLAELAGTMRQDPQFAYLFKPRNGNSGGMNSRASQGQAGPASGNPYLAGGSLTARLQLELENPDLAATMKAEAASAARNSVR
jgi:hypothetical protein